MEAIAPDRQGHACNSATLYSGSQEYTPEPMRNTRIARISRVLGRFTTNINSIGGLLKGLQGFGGLYIFANQYNGARLTASTLKQMNLLTGYCDDFKNIATPLNILACKDLPECLSKLRTNIHSNEAVSSSLATIGKIAKIALATIGSYIWLAEKGVLSQRAVSVCRRANLPLGLIAAGLGVLAGCCKVTLGEKMTGLAVVDKICIIAFSAFDLVTGLSSRALAAIPDFGSTVVVIGKNLHAFAQELGKAWDESKISSCS